ncbi:MAG: helix-turn-helix domain-containing protein [Pseudomonadota bacterium]
MSKPFTTGFLIFPGFPMSCLTSVIEPLRAANEISGSEAFDWQLLSEGPGQVASSARIEFEPDQQLDTTDGLDQLLLLSAPTADFDLPSSGAKLRSLHRHGTVMGGISGGVFPLARVGLASDTPFAVHWCYEAAFAAEFPNLTSSDRVMEVGSNMVTAAGAAAAFDLSLHMIETQMGAGLATEVACWFQHPIMRREGVSQIVPALCRDRSGETLTPLVERAVKLFSECLAEPIRIQEIAETLGITPRHLERTFKQATGLNPTQYYRKLRMDAARQMILYTNEKLPEISAAVGYNSLQVFRKHYTNAFGVSPKADRSRINLFRVQENLLVPSA